MLLTMRKLAIASLVAVIALVGAFSLSFARSGTQRPALGVQLRTGSLWPWTLVAKSRPGISGASGWVNTIPISAQSLEGRPTLFYFWSSSCQECLGTLPYLQAWKRKYEGKGLAIVAVHAQEAQMGRFGPDVETAMKDLGVRVPVALDDGFALWEAFGVKAWPTALLYGADGHLLYKRAGEGGEDATERAVQAAFGISDESILGADTETFERQEKPETELGYKRSSRFMSPEKIAKNKPLAYSFPEILPINTWALEGEWKVGETETELVTAGGGFRFHADAPDINVVTKTADGNQTLVTALIDGKPVPQENLGHDLVRRDDGSAFTYIEYPRLSWLVKGLEGDHVLELRFARAGAIVSFVNFANREETMK